MSALSSSLSTTFCTRSSEWSSQFVGRPDPSKGFDGKVWIDWTCSEWKQAVRGSVNRPAGTWEIKTEKKEDGSVKGVTGESYEEMMVEYDSKSQYVYPFLGKVPI